MKVKGVSLMTAQKSLCGYIPPNPIPRISHMPSYGGIAHHRAKRWLPSDVSNNLIKVSSSQLGKPAGRVYLPVSQNPGRMVYKFPSSKVASGASSKSDSRTM